MLAVKVVGLVVVLVAIVIDVLVALVLVVPVAHVLVVLVVKCSCSFRRMKETGKIKASA